MEELENLINCESTRVNESSGLAEKSRLTTIVTDIDEAGLDQYNPLRITDAI
jgi:hypothetical protein